MALTVKVVGDHAASFKFGTYAQVTRFRHKLATLAYGIQFGTEYRLFVNQPCFQITPIFMEGMSFKGLSKEFKNLDIFPLYCLSDCDDIITQKECCILYAIMDKHKTILKKKEATEAFIKSYMQLMNAFKAGRGESDEPAVLFC
jgi:hypothetical protein